MASSSGKVCPSEHLEEALSRRKGGGIGWRSETELNFKFYRQATNKIVGISDEAAAFLRGFF